MALSEGLLLDTHAWIWLRFGILKGTPQVLSEIREAAEKDRWFVSSFAFYEIAHAVARKRLSLDMPLHQWLLSGSVYGMPTVIDMNAGIAASTLSLPAGFHGDPGDRILTATAMTHKLTVCTHDKTLLRFAKQGMFRGLKVSEKKVNDVR